MGIFARIAQSMQDFFGTIAEQIASHAGLIQREREFSGRSLLATFVLTFLHKPKPKWDDFAVTAGQLGVFVTPPAIIQRISPELRDALRQWFDEAVGQVVQAVPRVTPLLRKFTAVVVGDSSTIQLCDALADEFPGCGGDEKTSKAAVKIQVQWDVLNGSLDTAALEPGKQNDTTSPALKTPTAGSLSLYDLGYFSLERFASAQKAGAFWISRTVWKLKIYVDGQEWLLLDWLQAQPNDGKPIDRWVEVGEKERLRCRLVALRAPAEVAARRRRKAHQKAMKKGRQPTAEHLQTCTWTVFLTNCPSEMLTWKEVVVLYRVRWQIELLFKLWKSHNAIDEHRSDDPVRQLVELYARLIAVIVQHWLILAACWMDPRVSLVKASRLLRHQVPVVIALLSNLAALTEKLHQLATLLTKLAKLDRRARHPSNPQLLDNPELLDFET